MGLNSRPLCLQPPPEMLRGPLTYYYTLGRTDAQIARMCHAHFDTSAYGLSDTSVKRFRKEWDLKKTRQQQHTLESIQPYAAAIKARFPQQGAQNLANTLRFTYNIRVPKSLVAQWLNQVEPDAVQRRRHRKFLRHRFWAAGVNDMWSFDQHDKWGRFGLFLHAGVEPVAGEIKWLRIWWNNSNPRLITSYYLEAARKLGAIPLVTQSDPGTENFGIANAHTYMRHSLDPSLADTLQHRWMRKHMNIKPEILWSILNRGWKPGFEAILQYGVDQDWYDPNLGNALHDLIFRWLSIPWLQRELDVWAAQYNMTPRRASKYKVLPHGIPVLIAERPADFNVADFKIPVPPELFDEVQQQWAPANHPVFELVPPYLEQRLSEIFALLGSPAITSESFWPVYLQVTQHFALDNQDVEEQALLHASIASSGSYIPEEPIVLTPGLHDIQEPTPTAASHTQRRELGDDDGLGLGQVEAYGIFTDDEDNGEDPGFL
ncbi:hypothetical protein C2E23DRAFT_866064 [Lenzites betulinus]|nr:hypothetical protein C2E23DRAFT_866064 [Lenzites betulinus]